MPRTFYHGTNRKWLGVGDVLRPGGMPDFNSRSRDYDMKICGRTEDAFEKRRPPGMIPRREAVFLIDELSHETASRSGAREGVLLEVEVEGVVERSDVHWWALVFDEVYQGREADRKLVARMIDAYWRGEPSDKPLWEYRVRSAVVTRVHPMEHQARLERVPAADEETDTYANPAP